MFNDLNQTLPCSKEKEVSEYVCNAFSRIVQDDDSTQNEIYSWENWPQILQVAFVEHIWIHPCLFFTQKLFSKHICCHHDINVLSLNLFKTSNKLVTGFLAKLSTKLKHKTQIKLLKCQSQNLDFMEETKNLTN